MRDRRLLRSNGHVAHVSLRGQVTAERFAEGEAHFVSAVVADLLDAPGGTRDRQLLRGEVFTCLETREGLAFGFAARDGYVGWLDAADLAAGKAPPTHKITAARSYGKSTPGLKAMGRVLPLPFGARLRVLEIADGWARVDWGQGGLHVPARHLAPLEENAAEPVAEAEKLIGTPYLWGGNSAFGMDCSGLVQAALVACGVPCPGDSDLQEAALGRKLAKGEAAERGDLLFWKGHVGWLSAPDRLLHANAHHMAVVQEPLETALARIGPPNARRRL